MALGIAQPEDFYDDDDDLQVPQSIVIAPAPVAIASPLPDLAELIPGLQVPVLASEPPVESALWDAQLSEDPSLGERR